METVRTVADMRELAKVVNDVCGPGEVRVEPYCYDDRIEWDTYIVTLDGRATGFTDGPLI